LAVGQLAPTKTASLPCGAEAARAVLPKLNIDYSKLSGWSVLCRKATSSMSELRQLFEEAGCSVTSFKLNNKSSNKVRDYLTRAASSDGAAIVLLTRGNEDSPGHYVFFLATSANGIIVCDFAKGTPESSEITLDENTMLPIQFIGRDTEGNDMNIFVFCILGLLLLSPIAFLRRKTLVFSKFFKNEITSVLCVSLAMFICGCKEHQGVSLVESKMDMGSFEKGLVTNQKISVRNRQKHEVSLNALKLSCSCMSTDFHAVTIPPGQTFVFSVDVSSHGVGLHSERGIIQVGPPNNEKLEFNLNFKITHGMGVYPEQMALGNVDSMKSVWPKTLNFKLVGNKSDVKIGDIVVDEQADGNRFSYTIERNEELGEGDFTIKMDLAERPQVGGYFEDGC